MLRRNERYEIDRSILEADHMRYVPTICNKVNKSNQQITFDIPRKGRVISLKNSYLEMEFDPEQANIIDFAHATDLST